MRLIDADKARRNATIDIVVHHLDRQPTVDAEPVVRCKDCEYRTQNGNCGHPRHYSILPVAYLYDYCSYGKRRKGK